LLYVGVRACILHFDGSEDCGEVAIGAPRVGASVVHNGIAELLSLCCAGSVWM